MIPLMKNAFSNEVDTCQKLSQFIASVPKLSMGDKCEQFEQEFAKYQERKYCILVNSGGSANLLLIQTLKNMGKIKKHAKVGFSSLTWSTNVMPIIQQGLIPIPIDCSIKTLNVMSDELEKTIKNHHIDVFFSTNVLGFMGDLYAIKRICEENNVLYIEDNCEALGSESNAIKAGNFGLASTFSFFVAHHQSSIEGGIIATDDEELAMNLTLSRANGWDRNLPADKQELLRKNNNIKSEFHSKYIFYDLGFNFRPTEITGFLGLNQLVYLKSNLKIRENNYKEIDAVIKNNDELASINTNYYDFIPAFSTPIVAKTKELRDKYFERFKDNVEIRPIIAGNITNQPFWNKYVNANYDLPGTDFIDQNGFYFTNDPALKRKEIDLIKDLLR